jgi:xanthine dehydrogenase accessory factor
MRDLLPEYEALLARGERMGRAVVTSVFGSAPRPPGATLLATAGGAIAGSVSGGCVEAATAAAIGEAIERGAPRMQSFGVSDDLAWEVGLPCGGTIEIFVEPSVRPEVLAAARGPGGVVVATVVSGGSAPGASLVVRDDGTIEGPLPPAGLPPEESGKAVEAMAAAAPAITAAAGRALASEASATERFRTPDGSELTVFLEVFARQPRLVVFGGAHVAGALVPLARILGYRTLVADGRRAFLTRERFPEADELILAWPEEAFARTGLDRSTYVCVLTHDPKFDDPALILALRSPAAYVGAIGSRKAQAARRKRLRDAGLSEAELARLRGPIGLDLGGRQPAETALAILAEMTAVRYGGSARPMAELQPGKTAPSTQPRETSVSVQPVGTTGSPRPGSG